MSQNWFAIIGLCVFFNFRNMPKSKVFLLLTLTVALLLSLADGQGGSAGGGRGHVHVKVFRGPTQGRPGQEFASWGYHAYLPPDEHPRHYRKWDVIRSSCFRAKFLDIANKVEEYEREYIWIAFLEESKILRNRCQLYSRRGSCWGWGTNGNPCQRGLSEKILLCNYEVLYIKQ